MFRVDRIGRFRLRVVSSADRDDWVQWDALHARMLMGPHTALSVFQGVVETDTMRFRPSEVASAVLGPREAALFNLLSPHRPR